MKPIWKSVGFWMGGVVLVFLLWAWGDSMWWETQLNRTSNDYLTGAQSSYSFLCFDKLPSSMGSNKLPNPVWSYFRNDAESRWSSISEVRKTIEGWFPPPSFEGPPDITGFKIVIPYWSIVGSYLPIWLVTVFAWRWRQRKQLAVSGL